MNVRGVPVIMYHGVGPRETAWVWHSLITPTHVFEGQMRLLREEGWTTIRLMDLYRHLSRGDPLPPKPVVLTFDDGYLNNWVYAYPILKRYGHRAVVWVSTDFVDPRGAVRPTLGDLWAGKATEKQLGGLGFLSWEEMRLMVASGHIEIQSHAKTHTWYSCAPQIVDFHRPRGVDGYVAPPWLGWNSFPERKYEYMTAALEEDVPYGTPLFRHERALAARRYFEDAALTDALTGAVARGGGRRFFERSGWRGELESIARDHPRARARFETEEEYETRVRGELLESRRAIEDALGTKVDFLCWPGGGRNASTIRIASEVGYLATTTHFLDRERRNVYGQNPSEINRIGGGSPWFWHGRTIHGTEPRFFIALLEAFAGRTTSLWKARLYKLKYLLRHAMRGDD